MSTNLLTKTQQKEKLKDKIIDYLFKYYFKYTIVDRFDDLYEIMVKEIFQVPLFR